MASSTDDQVAAMGSALTSAEIVISWAATARISAVQRHGQVGGAEEEIASDALPAGALPVVIGGSQSTSPKVTNIADQASRLT